MKYCTKCGNELEDDALFCSKCGSSQKSLNENQSAYNGQNNYYQQSNVQQSNYNKQNNAEQSSYNQSGYPKPQNGRKPRRTPKAVTALIVTVIVLFFVLICAGTTVGIVYLIKEANDGYKGSISIDGAVTDLVTAMQDGDGDGIMNAICSKEMKKVYAKIYNCSESDLSDIFEANFSSDDINKIDVSSCHITDKEKLAQSDIDDLIDDIEESTNIKVVISDAYTVQIAYKSYDDDEEEWINKTEELTVYEAHGKWYVMVN